MSSTEFLSASELHDLTGFARAAEQDAWLAEQEIPGRLVDGRSRMIVSRFHVRRARMQAEVRELRGQRLAPYLLRPDMPRIQASHYPPQGEISGLYAQFSAAGELLYVGKSSGVGYRSVQHMWAARRGARPAYATYIAVEVSDWDLDGLEVAHIHALQPPLNWLPPVKWPGHDNAVALIRAVWEGK